MAVFLTLKVVPRAGKTGIQSDRQGRIVCRVKSAPEDGKANRELIKLLSKILCIPQDAITIVTGATSRTKRIKIEGFDDESTVYKALGISVQTTIQG